MDFSLLFVFQVPKKNKNYAEQEKFFFFFCKMEMCNADASLKVLYVKSIVQYAEIKKLLKCNFKESKRNIIV